MKKYKMTVYVCPRCHYETNHLANYKTHLLRKVECDATFSNESILSIYNKLIESKTTKRYYCEKCDKIFKSRQGKYQHKLICNMKELQKDIASLNDAVRNQPSTSSVTINNNYNYNINNNNVQGNYINGDMNTTNNDNRRIIEFGSEDLDYISDAFIRKCLKKLTTGFEDLTKEIHFNPEKPEYHNITTGNKKDTLVEIYKEGKWQYADKNATLDALIKKCFDILSSHFDLYEDEIKSEMTSLSFKKVDKFVESVLNNNKTVQNTLRKCLYILILNNRDMVDKE